MATSSGFISSGMPGTLSGPGVSFLAVSTDPAAAEPPTVAAASHPSIDTLEQYDRSGRASPPLQGRVHSRNRGDETLGLDLENLRIEKDRTIAQDIENSELSAALRDLLLSERWEVGDLAKLAEAEGSNLFISTLCEQAGSNRSQNVLNLLPRACIEGLQADLLLSKAKYTALSSIIQSDIDAELDEAPDEIGEIPFLTPQERQANRDAYFPQGVVDLDGNLREWLSAGAGPMNI